MAPDERVPDAPGLLFVAGMNHRTAPVAVREQLALEEEKIREILADLAGRGFLHEVMILSTCNRVEVYGVAAVPGEARSQAFSRLGSHRGMAWRELEPLLYTATGDEAALHALMSQAFSAAKRVRSETLVGRLAVSISYAAVELARRIFEGLEGKSVLLVGAGEMSELAARHLIDQGALPVYVANRTWSRAQELARGLGGVPVPFDQLEATLAQVDIVITSTAAPEPVVTAAQVRAALQARRGQPLFFIDIAVPRNVEPAVNDLEGAFCYDIDDLRAVVESNLKERQREAQRAQTLLEREVEKFVGRLQQLEVVPTIVSLREKLEAIRRAELERALARLPGAAEDTRRVMDALSQAIVNKVLHAPMAKLKDSSRAGHGRRWTEMISELFGLRGPGPGPSE